LSGTAVDVDKTWSSLISLSYIMVGASAAAAKRGQYQQLSGADVSGRNEK
jgi:hypothetical protein